jgi:succinyl-diaminopimelate desuccinylase
MISLPDLLADLVAFRSITPHDAGCQDYLAQILTTLGFECQRMDHAPVSNLFARIGTHEPLFVFAGHTDVVPTGDASQWLSDPFVLHLHEGLLYGRGTADMKGSIAAMVCAAERFLHDNKTFKGSLGFLITSGEEGDDFDRGTPFVMTQLQQQGMLPEYCVVGEPSSQTQIGDVIKIGRRGSLTGQCVFQGKQGHVAYPHLAENPIHTTAQALSQLVQTEWDEGNVHFPPTSLQITHVHAGGDASNVIPGELTVHFNIRYSTEQTAESLMHRVEALFQQHGLKISINWRLNGKPFLTKPGKLLSAATKAIVNQTGRAPELSTSGGTSDARFIAPFGVEVIELGPVNATIHQINECVSLSDLEQLSDMYYAMIKTLIL